MLNMFHRKKTLTVLIPHKIINYYSWISTCIIYQGSQNKNATVTIELVPVSYIKVPKTKTQRSPKNRTILYGLYVRGKSDLNIEVPYGPINVTVCHI
jgi:hypothetical protein